MEKDYIYNVLLERGYNTYTARLVTEELLKLHKPLSEYLIYWLGNESHRKRFYNQWLFYFSITNGTSNDLSSGLIDNGMAD